MVNSTAQGKSVDEWAQVLIASRRGGTTQVNSAVQTNHTNMIVFGEASRMSLLRYFRNYTNTNEGLNYALSYSYISLDTSSSRRVVDDEQTGKDENEVNRIDIWHLSCLEHLDLLEPLIKRLGLSQCSYMFTFDLRQAVSVSTIMLQWLHAVEAIHQQIFQKLGKKEQETLQRNISSYLQFYVDPSVSDKIENRVDSNIDVDLNVPRKNLGVPIFFVALNADYFFSTFVTLKAVKNAQGGQVSPDDQYDFLLRQLRSLALQYGASLHYVHTIAAEKDSYPSIELVQQYVEHRLCSTLHCTMAKLVGTCQTNDVIVSIPAGFDSLDLIESSVSSTAPKEWASLDDVAQAFNNTLVQNNTQPMSASVKKSGLLTGQKSNVKDTADRDTLQGIVQWMGKEAMYNQLQDDIAKTNSTSATARTTTGATRKLKYEENIVTPSSSSTKAIATADDSALKEAIPTVAATSTSSKSKSVHDEGAIKEPSPDGQAKQVVVKNFFQGLLNTKK